MGLNHAMWIHGTSIQIENAAAVRSVVRRGYNTRIEGNDYTSNWMHFAIPTLVAVADRRLRLHSVLLKFNTGAAEVTRVHVYDGPTKILSLDDLHLGGNYTNPPNQFARFELPAHPLVYWAIGISVQVGFGDAGTAAPWVEFSAAGADFID